MAEFVCKSVFLNGSETILLAYQTSLDPIISQILDLDDSCQILK